MNNNTPNAIIFSLAIVIAALILSHTVKNRNNSSQLVSVTGLAKQDFVSDLIIWEARFSRKSMDMQDAYNLLKTDAEAIRKYLVKKGIKEGEMIFSSVDINKDWEYEYDDKGRQSRTFTGFSLNQELRIESQEVDKIESLSREITELIESGIELSSERPQYYFTKLADLKIEMMAEATADATRRAQQITENARARLGPLRNAKMGVFQITAQNSSEDFTWGGVYNTTSKNKTASVTVKLEFGIK